MYVVVRGSESIKFLEAWAAPFLIVAGLAPPRLGGCQSRRPRPDALARRAGSRRPASSCAFFVPSLTAMVGFWATLALNIPDLSRFAKSQKAQVWGQFLGLPTTMTLFAFIGVAVTSASVVLFGEAIWDPVKLLSKVGSPVVVLVSLVALLVATLTTNVAANVVAPGQRLRQPLAGADHLRARRDPDAGSSASRSCPGSCSSTPIATFGWLIAYSGLPRARSPASSSPTTGSCAGGKLALAELYRRDGLYGQVELPGDRRARWPGWRRRSSGSWCRRCGFSTTTPGSSASRWRSPFTPCSCAGRRSWTCAMCRPWKAGRLARPRCPDDESRRLDDDPDGRGDGRSLSQAHHLRVVGAVEGRPDPRRPRRGRLLLDARGQALPRLQQPADVLERRPLAPAGGPGDPGAGPGPRLREPVHGHRAAGPAGREARRRSPPATWTSSSSRTAARRPTRTRSASRAW